MNEFYAKLEITGESETLMQLRNVLFTHYTEERINETIKQELANPIRQHGIDYFKDRIERHKDENGGYYYLNLSVWEPIVGPEANVDLTIINDRKLRVRIATRCMPDLDELEQISAMYPEITFQYHQLRCHMAGELICVIRNGKNEDCIWSEVEETEDHDYILTHHTYSKNEAQSRLRMRIETLDENGEWVLGPLRIVDESMVYPGCAHDLEEARPPVVYVY